MTTDSMLPANRIPGAARAEAPTSARLIYLMGPSGAGKDSVLGWLRANSPSHWPLHCARRTITRAPQPLGEPHEAIDEAGFDALQRAGAFALAWQANRLRYGIRASELDPLRRGHCVIVNGSRGYLGELLARYPHATLVQISASPERLRQRLLARGREDEQQIDERIARASAFVLPAGAHEIRNDGTIEQAGKQLLRLLRLSVGADD